MKTKVSTGAQIDKLRQKVHASPVLQAQTDVIIPVLNERNMLPEFLARLESLELPLKLIFVDNGSDDGTVEFLRERESHGLRLILHDENFGYGRSLADGLAASTAPQVVIIDADCEYPPEAIPQLLAGLQHAALVHASRFLDGSADMSRLRAWGNRALTGLFNVCYGEHLSDLYTGMKALRREAFDRLALHRSGFEHVVELTAGVSRRKEPIGEIAIAYRPRASGKSKMRHLPEFLKAVGCLLYFRLAGNLERAEPAGARSAPVRSERIPAEPPQPRHDRSMDGETRQKGGDRDE